MIIRKNNIKRIVLSVFAIIVFLQGCKNTSVSEKAVQENAPQEQAQQKQEQQASQKQVLQEQVSAEEKEEKKEMTFDKKQFELITDNYQLTAHDGKNQNNLHLYIGKHLDEENYFVIYDNTNKPQEIKWIEGKIVSLDKTEMVVEVNREYLNNFDYGWTIDNDCVTIKYEKSDNKIRLSNNESVFDFEVAIYYFNPKPGIVTN